MPFGAASVTRNPSFGAVVTCCTSVRITAPHATRSTAPARWRGLDGCVPAPSPSLGEASAPAPSRCEVTAVLGGYRGGQPTGGPRERARSSPSWLPLRYRPSWYRPVRQVAAATGRRRRVAVGRRRPVLAGACGARSLLRLHPALTTPSSSRSCPAGRDQRAVDRASLRMAGRVGDAANLRRRPRRLDRPRGVRPPDALRRTPPSTSGGATETPLP